METILESECNGENNEKNNEENNEENFKFSDFQISKHIVKALSEMGYEHPTSVQKKTILPALTKRDLIVLSRTGSGKTAAFGVPAVQLLYEGVFQKALVLAPTRELAVQVEAELAKIAKYTGLKSVVVYGKHSIDVEVGKIAKGLDILVGTPGRVLDHLEQGNVDLTKFDLVVLDEADRMLDMGFIDQVDKIISNTSSERKMYLFSATIPDEIMGLSLKYLNEPFTVKLESDVKTVEEVEQFYYHVRKNEKRSRLLDVLTHHNPESCIVFCNTRFEVDRVTDFLVNYGITAKSIHGANSQSLRLKFLNQFKKGDFKVLVATDVAARGLHIEGLELVINYNLPVEKDSYVHRIGRTGRAGKKGLALTFVQEGEFYQLYTLEEHAGVRIEELSLPETVQNKKRQTANKDLYGIAFRELSKYDPESGEVVVESTGNRAVKERPASKNIDGDRETDKERGGTGKKRRRRRSSKNAKNPEKQFAKERRSSEEQAGTTQGSNSKASGPNGNGAKANLSKENAPKENMPKASGSKSNVSKTSRPKANTPKPNVQRSEKSSDRHAEDRKYVFNVEQQKDEAVQVLKVEKPTKKSGMIGKILGIFKKGGKK